MAPQTVGADRSSTCVRHFIQLTGISAILAEGADPDSIADRDVDLCVGASVMEYVSDEADHAFILAWIAKLGGQLHLKTEPHKRVDSCFRKSLDGWRVLDSVHVRRCASVGPLRRALEAAGLEFEWLMLHRLVFQVLYPVVRVVDRVVAVANVRWLFLCMSWCWMERVALPIARYREIELRRTAATPR